MITTLLLLFVVLAASDPPPPTWPVHFDALFNLDLNNTANSVWGQWDWSTDQQKQRQDVVALKSLSKMKMIWRYDLGWKYCFLEQAGLPHTSCEKTKITTMNPPSFENYKFQGLKWNNHVHCEHWKDHRNDYFVDVGSRNPVYFSTPSFSVLLTQFEDRAQSESIFDVSGNDSCNEVPSCGADYIPL